jgi:hypothetical protein
MPQDSQLTEAKASQQILLMAWRMLKRRNHRALLKSSILAHGDGTFVKDRPATIRTENLTSFLPFPDGTGQGTDT